MMLSLRHLAILAALLVMSGCAALPPLLPPSLPPSSRPSTPSQPSQPMPPPPVPLPPPELPVPPPLEPAGLPPAEPPALAVPSENSAVVALLRKSQEQSSAGQLDAASASLERALRIEPRNPVLWQRLARVRLEQKDYQQAENLAAKSNSLAGSDRRLRGENWRIIGEARSRRGDRAGAKAAFERAARE